MPVHVIRSGCQIPLLALCPADWLIGFKLHLLRFNDLNFSRFFQQFNFKKQNSSITCTLLGEQKWLGVNGK